MQSLSRTARPAAPTTTRELRLQVLSNPGSQLRSPTTSLLAVPGPADPVLLRDAITAADQEAQESAIATAAAAAAYRCTTIAAVVIAGYSLLD